MSQDSQCSINSLELMSQETHEVLQALLNSDKGSNIEQPEFQAKYRLNPFDIHLAEENDPENLQINIERLYSFPLSRKPEPLDFSSCNEASPPSSHSTHNNFMTSNYSSQQHRQQQQQQQQHHHQQTNDLINQQIRPHVQPADTSNNVGSRQYLVPPNTDFPGPFLFDIGFQEEKGQPVKSAPWTYSPQLQKLFIKMRCLVPIRFILKGHPPPGSYIKGLVVYNKPEHYREIVERCVNHITKQNDGHRAPKHLLRCENASTVYETCPLTGCHVIKVPIRDAEAGVDYFTEMFQFMCFNSCPGGLNRRSIIVIFTLEYNGQVLGRKILNPRICACPGRDRGNEETADQKKKDKNSSSSETTHVQAHPEQVSSSSCHETPPPIPVEDTKPVLHAPQENHKISGKRSATKITEGFQLQSLSAYKKLKREEDEIFTIQVRGREKYELLLKIKEAVDLMDMVPQSYIDSYRMGCLPCGPNWFLEQQKKLNEERERHQENIHDSQEISNSQNSDSDGTPPTSSPPDLSQLSRTSSNTSSQGSGNGTEYSTVRFTLKRTVSLERKGLKKKEIE